MSNLNLYRPLNIGGVTIPGNVFMAPLAGYTDRAFRSVSSDMGADLCYTEMVSCEALIRHNVKTTALMEKAEAEKNYAIQLFSGKADVAAQAVKLSIPYKPSIIDLNCGCPVPKIVKSGAGSALMQNPDNLYDIVKAMCDVSDIPITVKIRTGWDSNSINFLEVADKALKAGAKAVGMHGRTRSQAYAGTADWNHLKTLKKFVSDHYGDIPVLGSGDLMSAQAAHDMLNETGIDGLLVARGAIGNPFIFREIRHFLQTGEHLAGPTPYERMEVAFEQLKLAIATKSEAVAVKEMKKQLCAYTKGLEGSHEIRNRIVTSENFESYEKIFRDYMMAFKEN